MVKRFKPKERITPAEHGESRNYPRQAVVIFHGIGEQQPMETLRNLVDGLFPKENGKLRALSKPDRTSGLLDLRRMMVPASDFGTETDFYELYWAHLMEGSTLAHVESYVRVLLWRNPLSVPPRLQLFWWGVWIILAVSVGLLLAYRTAVPSDPKGLLGVGALAALMGVLVYAGRAGLRAIAVGYIADVARYFRPAPENIGVRQNIRNEGLIILRELHNETMQRYDRIVVVGHSLGSVIAYDILTHLWQEMHWQHVKPVDPHQPCYDAMKELLEKKGDQAAKMDSFRSLQPQLLQEEQSLGMPWKITDFVTVGSPLTYSGFLISSAKHPLDRRLKDRELPTCPPQVEDERDVHHLSSTYCAQDGKTYVKKILHHAALFACTRWTNIYFDHDVIGGRLGPLKNEQPGILGDGIKDLPLKGETLRSKTPLSHVRYWNSREEIACKALREVIVGGRSKP